MHFAPFLRTICRLIPAESSGRRGNLVGPPRPRTSTHHSSPGDRHNDPALTSGDLDQDAGVIRLPLTFAHRDRLDTAVRAAGKQMSRRQTYTISHPTVLSRYPGPTPPKSRQKPTDRSVLAQTLDAPGRHATPPSTAALRATPPPAHSPVIAWPGWLMPSRSRIFQMVGTPRLTTAPAPTFTKRVVTVSPEHLDSIMSDLRVGAQNRQVFQLTLGNQYSIKRITMVLGKRVDMQGMLKPDRQARKGIGL